MKKRVLALVMSTAMIASVLTACGGGSSDAPATDSNTGTTDANTTTEAEASTEAATEEKPDLGGAPAADEVVVWVADNVVDFTKEKLAEFQEANPDYAGFSVRVESVGEGDAANNMITDVEGGALTN